MRVEGSVKYDYDYETDDEDGRLNGEPTYRYSYGDIRKKTLRWWWQRFLHGWSRAWREGG